MNAEDIYYEPEYCDYCGGPHNSGVCVDMDTDLDEDEEDD